MNSLNQKQLLLGALLLASLLLSSDAWADQWNHRNPEHFGRDYRDEGRRHDQGQWRDRDYGKHGHHNDYRPQYRPYSDPPRHHHVRERYRYRGFDHDHHHRPSHHRPNFHRMVVNAAEYFFLEGLFYLPSNLGYVSVRAPVGAVVDELPLNRQVTYWRNQPYYIVDDTYYRRHPRGYVVVDRPGYR